MDIKLIIKYFTRMVLYISIIQEWIKYHYNGSKYSLENQKIFKVLFKKLKQKLWSGNIALFNHHLCSSYILTIYCIHSSHMCSTFPTHITSHRFPLPLSLSIITLSMKKSSFPNIFDHSPPLTAMEKKPTLATTGKSQF